MNRVFILGNLGSDPELKYLQNGSAILRIRMATNERFKRSDGTPGERTEWHTVLVWGTRAEQLAKMLQKGTQLLVEGSLRTRQWEDKDGTKRWTTEISSTQTRVLAGGRRNEREEESDDISSEDTPF